MKTILPSIVIGLGGTGVKTITNLKKSLLEEAPEMMQFLRFLAIDIDELKGEVASAGLFKDPIRLDPQKNEFYRIMDQTREDEARNIPSISNWFPEGAYRYLPLTEGARQAKPIGRLGFFLDHTELARWLHRLTDRIVTPETRNRFPGLKAGELNIYIVTSLCGGTGAGLFIDITYELRYLQYQAELPQKTRLKGLFALGDVYDAISNRVLANTYASLREINWVQRQKVQFSPVYPDGSRDVIETKAFDAIYLFGSSNHSDIEFGSPADFAQLCSDFIFLDSGADRQEDGDSLSAMIQSARNNTEVYSMSYDPDGTPRCYSSLGLCKIRFPIERVADLCAVRMAQRIIKDHITGSLSRTELLEVKRKAQAFLTTEGFACNVENSDLLSRLVEKQTDMGELVPLDSWITQSLAKAFNNDMETIKRLEISRINQIVNTLNTELDHLREEMPLRLIEELQSFHNTVDGTVKRMFTENLGISFVAGFLDEILQSAYLSREYAQEELQNCINRQKQLADQLSTQISELTGLLGKGMLSFLRMDARKAQLRETYRAIRHHFINEIRILKTKSAIAFYNGVTDAKKRIMEDGEGTISHLSQKVKDIESIKMFITEQQQILKDTYENNKKINGSPFEILIYDNDHFTEMSQIFQAVYSDTLCEQLFQSILTEIGGSIWNINDYTHNEFTARQLKEIFISTCKPFFLSEIDKKTVAQRIIEARNHNANPKDYAPSLQGAYEVADCFCRLNNAASHFADLRESEQAIACVVVFRDNNDDAYKNIRSILKESMTRGGKQPTFSHTSDRHSILIYRELSGFPSYTLSRITAYYNKYMHETRRENTPPLQMFTRDPLPHIMVPTSHVLSRFVIVTIEALALGTIIFDKEYYFMVTPDQWRRRTLALEAQARGEFVEYEDRQAGNQIPIGSKLDEVFSRLNEKLSQNDRTSSRQSTYKDLLYDLIAQWKKNLMPEMHCDLLKAFYFKKHIGTNRENIDMETDIRPAVKFILKRDFGLEEEYIRRPSLSHQKLLKEIHLNQNSHRLNLKSDIKADMVQ
ncbi:MAG: tubulin-like doman-containing protein [Desulfobacteraceae bacterium]